MTFSSIPFLFFFFPVVMLLYFAVPGKLKNPVLLIGSLAFTLWGSPQYFPLILLTVAMFYGCGLAIAKADERVAPMLEGMQIVKELYVPGKLVNLVVKPQ